MTPTDADTLAERLRQARQARHLSMRGLAEHASEATEGLPAAQIGHATISLIEAGRQNGLDAGTAVRIARALGCTVEWLVTGVEPCAS